MTTLFESLDDAETRKGEAQDVIDAMESMTAAMGILFKIIDPKTSQYMRDVTEELYAILDTDLCKEINRVKEKADALKADAQAYIDETAEAKKYGNERQQWGTN